MFAPVRQTFSYRWPPQAAVTARPGLRIGVPFGSSQRVGIVVGIKRRPPSTPRELKYVIAVLDGDVVFDAAMLALARWSADYYQHALGDVLANMLPTRLRRMKPIPAARDEVWQLTASGREALAQDNVNAVRQRWLLCALGDGARTAESLREAQFRWRPVLNRLRAKGWVEAAPQAPAALEAMTLAAGPDLNDEQRAAVDFLCQQRGRFAPLVLQGITGSGKTEVYMQAIAHYAKHGCQSLVLVPEIVLTNRLVERFRARFGSQVAVMHSGLSEGVRARTWAGCREGRVSILLGTRSAVWLPLPHLGLIVVDEEHDPSYKQQEGFRYSARDVAIVRAQRAQIPVMLGSATPSLESLYNVVRGRYDLRSLTRRARAASLPRVSCLDVRGLSLTAGLSEPLTRAMHKRLERDEQVLLFLNRRGYAPVLMCRNCGDPKRCSRCDAGLVFHKERAIAKCHHCDWQRPVARIPACCAEPDLEFLGLGTERIEEAVAELFAGKRICRIDRDSVGRKDGLDGVFDDIASGRVDIVIGTQMLAKGHDFPNVTLVGVIDTDNRLYSTDFRAEEHLAQLIVQVSGRAGRADKPGEVLIQTHHPEHPIFERILAHGYEAYAQVALGERRAARLPPVMAMVIVRAEAIVEDRPQAFLRRAHALLQHDAPRSTQLSHPLTAAMPRKRGKYRGLLVILNRSRASAQRWLSGCVPGLEALAREERVRWALDVDPQDTR